MLTLYDCSTAPSPRRARMFLAEKNLDWLTVEIDLRAREQLSPAFLEINSAATVPVLETDSGQRIAENIGIAAYVEALHPDPPLMGRTPLEKAEVLSMNSRIEQGGLTAIANILRNSSPHMKDRALPGPNDLEQIPALAERGRKRLGWFFDDIEAHLSRNDYAAGTSYSLADITLTVVFDFSRWVKAQPGEDHPALSAYMKRMIARPSYSL